MQVVNDYDKDVFNGDLGLVTAIDIEAGELVVDFDGREVAYDFGELDELVLAYATTVHKAQGSEYPAVVIPVTTQHYPMLQRNLLYTGVTRGRQLVVLVAQRKAVAIAVGGARSADGGRSWASGLGMRPRGPGAGSNRVAAPILFTAATLGHFALVASWLRLLCPRLACRDEFAFFAAVIGLGSFQAVLHTVAFTAGLSLDRGLAVFALVHLVACLWVRRVARRRGDDGKWSVEGEDAAARGGPARLLRLGGLLVVSALVVQWGMAATRSLFITGADAVHYHVPYAVNIALGANPFGPTATPHLYPMGTSVTAAWFILPFRDPLLVDLAVLPAFLLAWLAVGRLVGLLTGRADLAWGPWCALLLFSTPLFRASLLMSADLFYAAAFLSVNALLLQVYSRSRVTAVELLSLGFATGMLLSAKVTGAFSAVLLFGLYGGAIVLRRAGGRGGGWSGGTRGRVPARRPRRCGFRRDLAGAELVGVRVAGGASRAWRSSASRFSRRRRTRDARFYVSVLKDVRDVPWVRRARAAVVLDRAVVRARFVVAGAGRGGRLPGARCCSRPGRATGGTRRARHRSMAFVVASGIRGPRARRPGGRRAVVEPRVDEGLLVELPPAAPGARTWSPARFGGVARSERYAVGSTGHRGWRRPCRRVWWYYAHQATGGGPARPGAGVLRGGRRRRWDSALVACNGRRPATRAGRARRRRAAVPACARRPPPTASVQRRGRRAA